MARHYPDLASASDWREIFSNQSYVLPRSGYEISARVYRAMSTRTWTFYKSHIFFIPICVNGALNRSGERFQNNAVSVPGFTGFV